jgi:glycosyltransferase involved in cell wall biosynthesis
MSEHIVGMMWNKNEGDIIADTISSALENVDTLVIADDGSSDNSWDVIQGFAAHHPEIEHIQRNPSKSDKGQRQALLDVIRSRYRGEDTWVQILESDIMVMDTDIRHAIKERSNGVALEWVLLNAVLDPTKDWDSWDTYPSWGRPIQQILTHGHKIEKMTYTFRPFKELYYSGSTAWRPWPQGFSRLSPSKREISNNYTPLLAHYGYRGPTHVYEKYSQSGRFHQKYRSWDFASPESVKATVSFFNGEWNSHARPMSREGWLNRKKYE